jgi:hypothetical protein
MIKAEFKSYGSYTTDSISQWDLNQKLTISGLDIDVAPVLGFSCFGMCESIIVQSKLSDGVITCDVPNAILQFGKNLNVDLCSETGGQYKAFEKMIIPVNRRKKPSDYLFTDNVSLSTYESIKADLEEDINSNKTYMDKVKTELKNDNKTLNGRIDTILTGTVNTTKLVTVHSATIRNNSASDLTFKISSKDNETLKSIKDKSPTVINANVIAKALDGVAINGKGIPSSYNVESTNDEYVITVYSGSSSVVGQYVFMAVVTIAYKDTATDISSAELKDIRTGANGTTYPTAGDAVRKQINDLKKELDDSNLDENVLQIQKNMNDIGSLKEDLDNSEERNIDPLNKAVFGTRKLLLATPIDEDWSGYMNEKGEIYAKDASDRWHKTYKLCSEDTTIKVKDYAGGNIKHCIFLDRSNNVISTTVGAWTQKMLDVSVPSGAKYVVVNATDSVDMIVCYTHIFDTDYNVAEKMNDVNIRMNSAEATIGNVKESLNSVTDTVFSEKKYASLKSVEETKKVTNRGTFDREGRANAYIVNTYIGQTLKAKGYCGGNVPLIVFFDSNDKFVSYIDPNMPWNDNVYQDVVVPEGAYKAYVNDNDGDQTIDLQGLQFEKYNIKQELERLEGLIPDSSKISYDLKQAQLQMAKKQRMNDFEYAKFDKAYFVLTIDDANKYLPDVYDLCHELGVPLCPAIIVGNLNTDYKNDGRTIKDICDLVVADGGEILAHSGKYITADSTEEDYADVFREPKIELENLGYTVRGIITAGGANYLSNDIRLDNWSRKYYDYSDQNGISSSKAYYRPRWWHHNYTMDGAKKYVDNAIKNKSFVVMAMHGSNSTSDLEHIDNLRELLEYIISKGTDKIVFTTWADVYDTFGSTVLEERIKALEEKSK